MPTPEIDIRQLVAYDFCPHFGRHYREIPQAETPFHQLVMEAFLRSYFSHWMAEGWPLSKTDGLTLWGQTYASVSKKLKKRVVARTKTKTIHQVAKVLDWFDLHQVVPIGLDVTLTSPLFSDGKVAPGAVKAELPFQLWSKRREMRVFLTLAKPVVEPHQVFHDRIVRSMLRMYADSTEPIECYQLDWSPTDEPVFESFTVQLSDEDSEALIDLHTRFTKKQGRRSILACAFCPVSGTCKKKGI